MIQKFYRVLIVLILAAIALSACAPSETPPIPVVQQVQVEVTRIVAGTPQVIEITSTAAPTQTAQPAAPTPLPAGSIQINAAGATFPLPLYTQWTYAYQYVDPSVAINYQGIGSGGGKKAIIDGTVDFAGSDSLLLDTEYAAGKDLQMYPIVASAVVPVYNIIWNIDAKATPAPVIAPLVLDRTTLVGIYNATITMWNDPAIVALNPDLKTFLPAAKITVVHR